MAPESPRVLRIRLYEDPRLPRAPLHRRQLALGAGLEGLLGKQSLVSSAEFHVRYSLGYLCFQTIQI